MDYLENTFEGGTNGTTITPGNSGGDSGSAWDAVTIGSGSAVTFDSSTGGLAGKYVSNAGNAASSQWSFTAPAEISGRSEFRVPSLPGSTVKFLALGSTAIAIEPDGKISFYDAGGTKLAQTVGGVGTNHWERVRWVLTPGSGDWEVRFDGSSETLSGSGANLGGSVTSLTIGPNGSGTYTVYYDDVRAEPNGTGGGGSPGVIAPASAALTTAVGTPTVSGGGGHPIDPSSFGVATTVTAPTVTLGGTHGLRPSGFPAAATPGTPNVILGVLHNLKPSGLARVAAVGSPTVAKLTGHALSPSGKAVIAAVGSPTIAKLSGNILAPAGDAVQVTVGMPVVGGGVGSPPPVATGHILVQADHELDAPDAGTGVRLTAYYRDAKTLEPVDPTTVTLQLRGPDANEVTYTFAGGGLTRVATGHYQRDEETDAFGTWAFRFSTTGPLSVRERLFKVARSAFGSGGSTGPPSPPPSTGAISPTGLPVVAAVGHPTLHLSSTKQIFPTSVLVVADPGEPAVVT